jgi:hypothetical protein
MKSKPPGEKKRKGYEPCNKRERGQPTIKIRRVFLSEQGGWHPESRLETR